MVMFFVRHSMVFIILNLFDLLRVSSHVDDFNTRNKVLTAKLLRQRYIYIINFVRRFQNFIGGILK